MKFENQDWERDLKNVLFAVLYQWKWLVAVAIVFAILVGGTQAYRTLEQNKANAANEGAMAVYSEEMEFYEREKQNLEARVADSRAKVEAQREYMENAEIMYLEPFGSFEAAVCVYVSTDYQIMPDMVYQNTDKTADILALYQQMLNGSAVMNQIAEEVNIGTRYLMELITVSVSADQILDIKVWHSDAAVANQIKDLLVMHMETAKPQITETMGEHSVDIVMETTGAYYGTKIRDKQRTEESYLIGLEENLLDYEISLDELAAPQQPSNSSESVAATGIKWAVVGGIAGVILCAMFVGCVFAFSGKVYSPDEMKERVDVKILGSILDKRGRLDLITGMVRKHENRIVENSDSNLEMIAENIYAYAGTAKTLLVTGSVNDSKTQALVDALQEKLHDIKLIFSGSILCRAEAVRMMKQCDGVLLVEKCGESKYSVIVHELERITDADMPIIGSIILD